MACALWICVVPCDVIQVRLCAHQEDGLGVSDQTDAHRHAPALSTRDACRYLILGLWPAPEKLTYSYVPGTSSYCKLPLAIMLSRWDWRDIFVAAQPPGLLISKQPASITCHGPIPLIANDGVGHALQLLQWSLFSALAPGKTIRSLAWYLVELTQRQRVDFSPCKLRAATNAKSSMRLWLPLTFVPDTAT